MTRFSASSGRIFPFSLSRFWPRMGILRETGIRESENAFANHSEGIQGGYTVDGRVRAG